MSLYFPLQKICTFRSPFTLPISLFLNGQYCTYGAEIRIEVSLLVAKKIRPLFFDSFGAIVLPIEKMNQTIRNRKRDCA